MVSITFLGRAMGEIRRFDLDRPEKKIKAAYRRVAKRDHLDKIHAPFGAAVCQGFSPRLFKHVGPRRGILGTRAVGSRGRRIDAASHQAPLSSQLVSCARTGALYRLRGGVGEHTSYSYTDRLKIQIDR